MRLEFWGERVAAVLPPKRVLVVEDNLDTGQSFARLLQLMGHEAEFISDPLQVMDTARRFKPEVVFLDIGLPVVDGYELARNLRGEFGFDKLRIVAITAYNTEQDRVRSRQSGFDAHVGKPADLAVIESILRTIFETPRF